MLKQTCMQNIMSVAEKMNSICPFIMNKTFI